MDQAAPGRYTLSNAAYLKGTDFKIILKSGEIQVAFIKKYEHGLKHHIT